MVRSKLMCKVLTVLGQGVGDCIIQCVAPLLAASYRTATPTGTRPLCDAARSAQSRSCTKREERGERAGRGGKKKQKCVIF